MSKSLWSLALLGAVAVIPGCGRSAVEETPTPGEGTETPSEGTPTPALSRCATAAEVPCEDAMILDLGLVGGTTSAGEILSAEAGGIFTTQVDATAGGFGNTADNPWIYMRFTKGGGERVDIDDLESLEDMTWDIAFKRYLIRVNSGDAGPGCLHAAPVATAFEALSAAPSDLNAQPESFYTEACQLITDDKGLGGPDVALGPWWGYNGCVTTTGQAFVLELASGEAVKLVVDSYYGEGQGACNESGTPGSGSANLSLRWAYLP